MTKPVVFIHGLWIHSVCWEPWQELVTGQGHVALAPGWPGDAESVAATRSALTGRSEVGVDEVTDHYAGILAGLDEPPIVIGHSFGGLIAQKLLDRGAAAAAVGISPAPIKGIRALPLSLLRTSLPVLSRPGNKHKFVSLTERQFAYSFGNTLPPAESAELYRNLTIPSPGRPLFEVSSANFTKDAPSAVDTTRADRGPLLLIAAGQDHTVPAVVVEGAYRLYGRSRARTDIIRYPDRGHSAAFDHGWRQLADDVLAWLARQGL